MSFASNSLRLIRTFFSRDLVAPERTNPFEYKNVSNSYQWGVGPQSHGTLDVWKISQLNQDIFNRYIDYTEMQYYPEIGAAIEIFADEATRTDTLSNRSIWVESSNQEIADSLNYTLHNVLRVEEKLWDWVYSMAAMGNAFLELVVQDTVGVIKIIDHPAPFIRAIADRNGLVYGFVRDDSMSFDKITTDLFLDRINGSYNREQNDGLKVFEPWEMVHLKIQTGNVDQIYGRSIADPARYAWKRLMMIEDAMVLYKLTRSPQRYVYYVDVGDVPPNEARNILAKVKDEFKKNKLFDENGNLIQKNSILSQTDDFFIAKRKGERTSEIDVLSGLDGQSVDDAEYFRNKLISALKIPKSYLGYDETISRANLGSMDLRFAKTVMRIQRFVKEGFRHICQVDLAAKNIDPDKIDFEIKMSVPSGALEISAIEVEKSKLDLAAQYQAQNVSEHFIWSKILGFSEDEIKEIKKQRSDEANPENKKEEFSSESKQIKSINSKIDQYEILEDFEETSHSLASEVKKFKSIAHEIRNAVNSLKKSK